MFRLFWPQKVHFKSQNCLYQVSTFKYIFCPCKKHPQKKNTLPKSHLRPSLPNTSKITRFIWVFMLPWIYNFDIESIQSRPFLPSVKQGNSFQVISWHLQSSCSRYFFPKTIWQSNIGNAEDNMTVHFSLLLQAQYGARARAASFYSAPV